MSTVLGKHFNTNLCLYGIINEQLMKQFRFPLFERDTSLVGKKGKEKREEGLDKAFTIPLVCPAHQCYGPDWWPYQLGFTCLACFHRKVQICICSIHTAVTYRISHSPNLNRYQNDHSIFFNLLLCSIPVCFSSENRVLRSFVTDSSYSEQPLDTPVESSC